MFDLGDVLPLSVQIKNTAGTLENAGAVVLTITLPDGTTVTPAVTNASAGIYRVDYTTVQSGRHAVRWVATGLNASAYTDAFDVDEAAPSGIVSLADVKAHLNITTTANDEELRRSIDAATDFVESRIGPVVQRTLTVTLYPSSGILFLTPPVVSLTTITAAYGYSQTYDVASYTLNGSAGMVAPNSGVSTFAYPVTVEYVGGRVIVPALIRQAALDYVKWMWESQRGATGLPLPGGADEFATGPTPTVPNRITQALEPYMTVAIA